MLLFIQFFSGNKEFSSLSVLIWGLSSCLSVHYWESCCYTTTRSYTLHNSFSLSKLRSYPAHLLKSYSSFSLSNIRSYYYCSSSNRMSCFSCSLSNLRFYFPVHYLTLGPTPPVHYPILGPTLLFITNLRSYSPIHYPILGPTLMFII